MNTKSTVSEALRERLEEEFLPLKVKEIIRKNNEIPRSAVVKKDMINVYQRAGEYLSKWTKHFEEFYIFKWMELKNIPSWEAVEKSAIYLEAKDVDLDDTLLFDQYVNLKSFLKEHEHEMNFAEILSEQKWTKYFAV